MEPLPFPEPPLRDDDLLLRAKVPDDVPALVAALQDSEIPRWTGIPTPYTVDSALDTLASSTSPSEQQTATHTLEQVMVNQVPVVTLYYGGSWGLFSTKKFTGWPSASDPYTLPTSYNNALLTVVTHLKKS